MTTSDEAVQALVTSSGVPLAAVDLPSGRLLAVNAALAGVLGSTVGETHRIIQPGLAISR